MIRNLDNPKSLAADIAHTEEKLHRLEQEIAEIGEPAAHELRLRLRSLQIEERALLRNFEEARAAEEPSAHKIAQLETLLHHIERQEASLEHAADFLHQGAPSSVSAVMRGGAKVAGWGARGFRKVLGDHEPLGSSALVNETYDSLSRKYDLPPEE